MSMELRAVRYRYAGTSRPALDGIDLAVAPGEVVGVAGASEAGKSTLCLVAAGLAPRTIGGRLDGSVVLDGVDAATLDPWELSQRCGVLFQNPATQLSGTAGTVWEEVAFGPRNLGLPLDEIAARVAGALEDLGVADLAARDPQRLSGGQAQLVALAGVLAMRPAYLVLDEPTSQLDPLGTRLVAERLAGLAAAGGAGVLVVEHKAELLAAIGDRVVIVAGGALVAEGAPGTVLADERLASWGVTPPEPVRLGRLAVSAGVDIPAEALA